MLSVILNSAFGGQGATIGLIISMFRAKSDRYKQMLKLAGVPALFNINEPLVFVMPIMLNPVFFLPMLFEPIINGLVSWGLIDLFHATVNPFIQYHGLCLVLFKHSSQVVFHSLSSLWL